MVKLGIVGIGVIACSYIELLMQSKLEHVQLVALSSRNAQTLHDVNEKYQCHAQLFTDYEAMLDSKQIDALIICTPHGVHPRMEKAAIERGIHVLVEKPLGIDQSEIKELIDLSRKHSEVVCGVLFNRRLSRVYQYVKELMLKDTVGELKRIHWLMSNCYRGEAYYHSSPWRGSYALEGGGILMSQVSHQLDLFLWFSGLPKDVYAQCQIGAERKIKVENEAVILMNFPSGASGQFIASAREFPGTNRLEISGSKGQIIVENDNKVNIHRLGVDEKIVAQTSSELFPIIEYDSEEIIFEHEDNSLQHRATIQNFIDAILNGSPIACSFEDALQSLIVTQAAYLSNWNNEKVLLPLNENEFKQKLNENE